MTTKRLAVDGALAGAVAAALFLGGASGAAGRAAAAPAPLADATSSGGQETVVFSGGCFWGVQAVFEHVEGVLGATAGYAGGGGATATYPEVSTGETGHAESVRVVYDPAQVSFADLLQVFFSVVHDPTQLNRQGPDHGTQYRSAIWYTTDAQARAAKAYIRQLTKAGTFSRPIVTEVNPLHGFFAAERYHQDYLIHHPHQPYIVINDIPKVEALKREFPALWRERPVEWSAETASSK